MIVITVTHPGMAPTTHRLEIDRIRIGREQDNDLVLEGDSCSRYHAEILCGHGVYKIVDLGSTNGVVVGTDRVQEHLIASESSVKIGDHTLSFSIPRRETPKTVMMQIGGVVPEPEPAPPPPSLLFLQRLSGKGGERSIKIVDGVEYVIGRSPGADVVVNDSRCSGRHAVISRRGGRCVIRDLESANGTFVNGDRVREAELRPGDRLSVGQVEFSIGDQPLETADEDLLLARTQLGIPVQSPERRVPDDSGGGVSGLGRGIRLGIAAVVAVVLLVMFTAIVWRVARLEPVAGDGTQAPIQEAPREVMVQVYPVEHKELMFSVTAGGTITPQRRVTVSAEVAARVLQTMVDDGTAVRKGAPLVRLDDREIRLQIEEARSSVSREQVDLAKGDFERKERLFADGAVTRSALDQAKNRYLSLDSAYRTAEARIAQLRERAAKTRVNAPLNGVVAQMLVEPGEFVGPGAPLVVIEDMEEILVVVEVADRDVVRLRPLQVVEATSDAFPGRIFLGVVERVGAVANPVTRGFEVEARIGNPDGELRSGMITTIRIVLEKRRCLVVPARALLDEREGEARVLLVSDGTARSVAVAIGRRQDRDVEILQGLVEGDEVVVYGHDRVKDGQPVSTYRGE